MLLKIVEDDTIIENGEFMANAWGFLPNKRWDDNKKQ